MHVRIVRYTNSLFTIGCSIERKDVFSRVVATHRMVFLFIRIAVLLLAFGADKSALVNQINIVPTHQNAGTMPSSYPLSIRPLNNAENALSFNTNPVQIYSSSMKGTRGTRWLAIFILLLRARGILAKIKIWNTNAPVMFNALHCTARTTQCNGECKFISRKWLGPEPEGFSLAFRQNEIRWEQC